MLVKLLKYDIKFGKNTFLSMAAGLILGSIILRTINMAFLDRLGIPIFIMFFVIPCAVISIVLVFQNYNKCLFGNQGYLMLTLPVKREKILLSQIITSILWFNVMIAAGSLMLMIVADADVDSIVDFMSAANLQICLIQLLLGNIVALFSITVLFLGISFSNISVQGKRLPGLLSGLITFLFIALEFKITTDFMHKIFGNHYLNYSVIDDQLVFLKSSLPEGDLSTDLVFFAGFIAFIVINFYLNLYLLNNKIDLK